MKDIIKVNIDLDNRAYDIFIGSGLLQDVAQYIKGLISDKSKIFIVTDSNVEKIYLNQVKTNLENAGYQVFPIVIPAGEDSKSFENLEKIVSEVLKNKPERKSTILALGGGVVGDITGFAASVILRGINFIQVPTSLLAMVDSSVGGKTAINSKFGKNLVGSFYQPKIVLADIDALKTLPEREIKSGFAEIVKYGVINDLPFFEYLNSQNDFSEIKKMVEASCIAKAKVVAADEKESNVRALLNLGHTFGHAFEALCGYSVKLLHGEAVGIGMIYALEYSEFLGICKKGEAQKLANLLNKFGMKTDIAGLIEPTADEIIDLMKSDKKVDDGKIVLILAEEIGKSFIKKDCDEKDLKKFLELKLTKI